jgi:sulfate permease, SulP family
MGTKTKQILSFIKTRAFPFLEWLPELKNREVLKADLIAGITVALVLIPQSMAYAQLA